jgi:hypothetical protein
VNGTTSLISMQGSEHGKFRVLSLAKMRSKHKSYPEIL